VALDSLYGRASNVRTMSISKDKIIAETGGFAWGEPRHWRVAEITVLEKRIRSGRFTDDDQRRLCQLKGIDFDEPEDHPNA
jgi:hypothetical protein